MAIMEGIQMPTHEEVLQIQEQVLEEGCQRLLPIHLRKMLGKMSKRRS